MALPAFETNLNIIQQLDDEPNDVGGLTAAELKAKFDEAGLTIQKWINETLLPAMIAANLAFAKTTDVPAETVQAAIENVQESSAAATQALGNTLSATKESLQKQITENYNALHEELLQAVIGSIPDTSVTYRKLASDITTILTTLQTGLSQARSKIEELDGREIVIDPATQTENGLMSATDKVKLDGIAANATRVLVDNALSETSTNAIQNRAVRAALAELAQSISQLLEKKAPKAHTHTKSDITDLTVDTAPTENSQNLVTSGGTYQAVKEAGDAAKDAMDAFKQTWAAVLMIHVGGVMAAQAHQGGGAAYSTRIQTDAFRDGSQIVENIGVFYGGECAELLTSGLQSAIIWSNPGADSDNKSWNVSNMSASITQTQQWSKLFDFDVPAFGMLTKLDYTVSISRRMTMKFSICDATTQQELAVTELATTGSSEAVTLEAPIQLLLDPNRRYSVYGWIESASSTSLKMTKLAFTITPQIYSSGAVTMAQLAIPAETARLALLLHDNGTAAAAALKFDSGEFATLTQSSAKADKVPGGTAATLRCYSVGVPDGAQAAQLKLTLNGSGSKLYDYALIAI